MSLIEWLSFLATLFALIIISIVQGKEKKRNLKALEEPDEEEEGEGEREREEYFNALRAEEDESESRQVPPPSPSSPFESSDQIFQAEQEIALTTREEEDPFEQTKAAAWHEMVKKEPSRARILLKNKGDVRRAMLLNALILPPKFYRQTETQIINNQ